MIFISLARLRTALCAATLFWCSSCANSILIDQALYERPDARGIQVTQVLLRGAEDDATPESLQRVGYNRYARAASSAVPTTIVIIIPDWGRGAGWLDPLARDLVAEGDQVEVWTLNRRQALLAALGVPTEDSSFLRRWDFALALRDLAIVSAEARARCQRVVYGGWGLVGGLQAFEAAQSAPAQHSEVFFLDAWIAPQGAGEIKAIQSFRAAAQAQLDAGALTAVGLDPRVRLSTPGDFGFVEQAAFEAERAPEEVSELVDRHPALAKSQRRFTNRGLFAWAFDRPRSRRAAAGNDGEAEELAQRGPLAGLQGLACAELERIRDANGAIDDAIFGAACGAPYELDEALIPFSAPGGPFEAFAPLIGWIDALDRLSRTKREDTRGISSVHWTETSTQRLFLDRIAQSAGGQGEESPSARVVSEVAMQRLDIDGDELAPLLQKEFRSQWVDALLDWMQQPAADRARE